MTALITASANEPGAVTSMVNRTARSFLAITANPSHQRTHQPVADELACCGRMLEQPHECPQGHASQDASNGQGSTTADTTERSVISGGYLHTTTLIPPSRSTPDGPACQPIHTILDTDEVPYMPASVAPSRHGSIPSTRGASPETHQWCDTPQDENLDASDRCFADEAGTDALSESACESSSRVSVPSFRTPGPTTPELDQEADENSSVAGSEHPRPESHQHRANQRCNYDYCPSATEEAEEMSLQGGVSDRDTQNPRKRRKTSSISVDSVRHPAARVKRPRRRRRLLRSKGENTLASRVLSPDPYQALSNKTESSAVLAEFAEWPLAETEARVVLAEVGETPLKNVSLKRITENGITTFQLQFDWTVCTREGHACSTIQEMTRSFSTQTGRGGALTPPTDYAEPICDDNSHTPPGEWEGRKIIGKMIINGELHYIVDWLPTPEPARNLGHMKQLIEEYEVDQNGTLDNELQWDDQRRAKRKADKAGSGRVRSRRGCRPSL